MESTATSEEKSKKKKTGYLKYTGILLLLIGLIILFFTYQPFLSSYFDYRFSPKPPNEIKVEITANEQNITKEINEDTEIVFVNSDFGIYIPKIKANVLSTYTDTPADCSKEYYYAVRAVDEYSNVSTLVTDNVVTIVEQAQTSTPQESEEVAGEQTTTQQEQETIS